MFDSFDGLWHDAVVRGYYQHHYVGSFCTARTHQRKGLVTRCVQKHYPARFTRMIRIRYLHAVSADMLGYAAGLARRNFRGADRIEQGSLAVIDVAHDSHYWRARQLNVVRIRGD